MQEKQKSGTAQIKKITNSIENNRKNIEGGTQVHESINSAKSGFSEFEGVIKGQTSTIDNLKTMEKSLNSGKSQLVEIKKYFNLFLETIKEQLNNLFKITESKLRWGSHKVTKEEHINKTKVELSKIIAQTKQQSTTPQKIFTGINRMLALKDTILCQLMKNMVYQKNVLWRDLNMKYDDYIHGEIKSVLNKMKENQEQFGYLPGSIQFKIPKLDELDHATVKIPEFMGIIIEDQTQLIESMQNFSKLSEQPQLLQDISQNQHVVKSLRDKIEVLSKNYNTLLDKYRGLQISKGKVQMGANQEKSLSQKIEDLENSLMKKQQDIIQLKQTSMKAESSMQSLKDKNRELEDQLSKWHNFQGPKIKELQNNQKAILDEFIKTKKDFDTYSNLYQVQREQKIKAYGELKDERNRLADMANILGRQRRKIKQLKQQLIRKQQIIMEIVEKAPDP